MKMGGVVAVHVHNVLPAHQCPGDSGIMLPADLNRMQQQMRGRLREKARYQKENGAGC